MTAPVQPPQDNDSSLIPAMLAAYAAYRLWRGGHDAIPRGWQQLSSALNLRKVIGIPLQMLAQRTLDQQRRDAGRAGDELWTSADEAVQAGIDAGVQTVAEGLLWTDKSTPDGLDPATRQGAESGHPGPYLPTPDEPPVLLAKMVASAVRNTTTVTAAVSAGWEKKEWVSLRDDRVRDTHVALNGTVAAMKDVFTSPSGARLRWPGDPRAPMSERANCRCDLKVGRR